MKRFLALVLVFTLALGALPVNCGYFTDAQLTALEESMIKRCDDILTAVYHGEYFDGGCAEWVNDQLIYNNIGYWYKGNYSYGYNDGNQWFGDLDEGAVTETGYTQVKYPGESAIYDLISEFGGHPIYNIVVSWEKGNGKWEASGHVLYIWCIYDGYVYYTDTFNQTLGDAGHIVKRTVDNFVELYAQISGAMIGAVHFEGDETVGFHPDETIYSEYIAGDMCSLRSAPMDTVGDTDTAVETVESGTALSVRGAYTDGYDRRWLKVEGGKWVKETDVTKNGNYSTIICENMTIPVTWLYHHAFTMGGTVTSHGGPFTYLSVTISDAEGNVVAGGEQPAGSSTFSLSAIDEHTYFEHFAPGKYRYKIEAANAFEHAVVIDEEFEILAYGRHRDEKFYEYTETHKMYTPCDTDLNGTVDATDLAEVHRTSTWDGGGYLCDVNGDGHINLTDMYLINEEIAKASE